MDITRDAGRVDVIHAGANGIDDFEVRKLFPNFRRDIPGQQAGYIIRVADLRPGAKLDLWCPFVEDLLPQCRALRRTSSRWWS
jgi:hypothetical protein